jgi:glycosyltransferase involved in cell wall biosynthesis
MNFILNMGQIKKVGIVAMFNLSAGGGAPKVTIDLINALNKLKREVFLLTPFKIDYNKIKEFYGEFDIQKVYSANKFKKNFIKGRTLSRKMMIDKFEKMAKEVDFIIDIDGGIFHKYLPKNFDKSKYVVWRISCVKPLSERKWIKRNFKEMLKEGIKNMLGENKCLLDKKYKIYPVDKWTAKELKENWNTDSEKTFFYPRIEVGELVLKKEIEKKKQIVVFGRIASNKSIENSIRIFALGIKDFPEYKLIIMGGTTADSEDYIKQLKKICNDLNILDKVSIIKNPSFEEVKKILQESKVIIDSQREISLTLTSIEAMAAGNIVLGYKNSGGYTDILDNGKYGMGFLTIEEGGEKLQEILIGLERKKISNKESIKRAKEFDEERFIKTLKEIIK